VIPVRANFVDLPGVWG